MAHHIYLDKLSTSPHRPRPLNTNSGSEVWRKTLVQTVPVPDLSHTGIKTPFTSAGVGGAHVDMLRPDGSVSMTLRKNIATEFKNLPKKVGGGVEEGVEDVLDMSYRDKEKRRRRAEALSKMKSPMKNTSKTKGYSASSNLDAFQLSDVQSSSIRRIEQKQLFTETGFIDGDAATNPAASTGDVTKGYPKKPFSADSLFNALLDTQVGDGAEKWNMDQYAKVEI